MALDGGYNHPLKEKGTGLSGGQIQRIAIARALLRKAALVLLDEPSAHLDAENEAKVQNAFDALTAQTTTITIAHRLHTIQRATNILVLDQGRVVEQGTHQSLLEHNGLYAALAGTTFDLDLKNTDKEEAQDV